MRIGTSPKVWIVAFKLLSLAACKPSIFHWVVHILETISYGVLNLEWGHVFLSLNWDSDYFLVTWVTDGAYLTPHCHFFSVKIEDIIMMLIDWKQGDQGLGTWWTPQWSHEKCKKIELNWKWIQKSWVRTVDGKGAPCFIIYPRLWAEEN